MNKLRAKKKIYLGMANLKKDNKDEEKNCLA